MVRGKAMCLCGQKVKTVGSRVNLGCGAPNASGSINDEKIPTTVQGGGNAAWNIC
jgi:hypothetical protein